jgi:hypothetical protein
MTETEIKKILLKEKPEARFSYIRKGNALYYADTKSQRIYFNIPVDDMGDADFGAVMPGQSLIRWIYLPQN